MAVPLAIFSIERKKWDVTIKADGGGLWTGETTLFLDLKPASDLSDLILLMMIHFQTQAFVNIQVQKKYRVLLIASPLSIPIMSVKCQGSNVLHIVHMFEYHGQVGLNF